MAGRRGGPHDTGVPGSAARRCRCFQILFPGFCGLAAALVCTGPGLYPRPAAAAALFLSLGAVAWLAGVLMPEGAPAAPALRIATAAGMLLGVYASLAALLPWSLPSGRELWLQAADRALFGYDWERWFGAVASAVLTDFLQVVYTSFFFGPLVLLGAILRRGGRQAANGAMDRLIFAFLLSYCGYLLMPARSPYEVQEFAEPLPTLGLAPWLHEHTVGVTATRHDCFPSGHVLIALYVAWLARGQTRPLFWAFLIWALLMGVATLYLRYHYLVDVVAGAAGFLALAPLMEWALRSPARRPPAEAGAPLGLDAAPRPPGVPRDTHMPHPSQP